MQRRYHGIKAAKCANNESRHFVPSLFSYRVFLAGCGWASDQNNSNMNPVLRNSVANYSSEIPQKTPPINSVNIEHDRIEYRVPLPLVKHAYFSRSAA